MRMFTRHYMKMGMATSWTLGSYVSSGDDFRYGAISWRLGWCSSFQVASRLNSVWIIL